MKELIKQFAVPMLALLALSSCNKEIDGTDTVAQPSKQITITAIHADDATRTTLIDGGTEVYWQPGDELYAIRGNKIERYVTDITEPSRVASFTGYEIEGDGEYVFIYNGEECVRYYINQKTIEVPIHSAQLAKEGSFSTGEWVTVGKSSSSNEVCFYAAAGGFRFTVSQEGIRQISFESIGGEDISGKVAFSMDSGVPVIQSKPEHLQSSRIILSAPEGGSFVPGEWYYITMLPTELSQGFRMTFFKTGLWASKDFTNPVSVKRGVIGSKQSVDEGITFNGYEYVDLGLPSGTLWATCNIGATTPEGFGSHYAWGETETKGVFNNWSNYKWGNGEPNTADVRITKYVDDSWGDVLDNKTSFYEYNYVDDAARANWGSEWRTPREFEMYELISSENTTWTWTTVNGVNGYLVTSKIEGYTDKSIFLPAAGFDGYDSIGSSGYYWSSDMAKGSGSALADYFRLSPNSYEVAGTGRFQGFSIRPVFGEHPVSGVSLNAPSSMILTVGHSFNMTAEVLPDYATNKLLKWTSSKESVASVSDVGVVNAVSEGEAVISVITADGDLTASCQVKVVASQEPELVDLGLSALWATFNLGAACPEGYGDYFAWGETSPKTSYSVKTYKFGWWNKLSKYNTDSSYGSVDNITLLEPEDDAAVFNWGGEWRMPTLSELSELNSNNCSWEKDTVNGIEGYRVSSLKEGFIGQSIFIPMAGYFDNDRSYTSYWASGFKYLSSSLAIDDNHTNPDNSWAMREEGYISDWRRWNGYTIRPVKTYGNAPATGIELDNTDVTIIYSFYPAATCQLTAKTTPANAYRAVFWSSSDPSIASVDPAGIVTAKAKGIATITATTKESGITASCTVTIRDEILATGLTIEPSNMTLNVNETQQIIATVSPSEADDKRVWFKVYSGDAVSVDSEGNVTGLKVGKASIQVSTRNNKFIKICHVTVTAPVTGVSLNTTKLTFTAAEQTASLTASVTPSNASNQNVSWTSSNTSVASVSASGVVTAKSRGTATITVTTEDGGFTATCDVTVTIAVSSVSLNKSNLSLKPGETYQLTASVSPSDANNKAVSWKSSNTSVASVSASGVVTAKSGGTATITVTTEDGGFTATCDVTVTIAVSSVSLNKSNLSLKPGETYQLTASVSPSDANNKAVSWESSNTSVASVSASGVVTAKSGGTATITVTTKDGGFTASCSVIVSSKPDPETITFSELGLTNAVQYSDPFNGGNFTITFGGGGNDGKYYNTGSGIRTYGGGTITVSSSHTISKIAYTWDGSYCPTNDVATPSGYSTDTTNWTGSAKTVTLTRPSGSGHWRLKSVTVTYSD